MSYADLEPIFEPTASLVPKLAQGELDGVFTASPVMPAPARSANESVPLRLLPIGRAAIGRLRGSYPFLRPVIVPPDDLPGQPRSVETLGTEWLLVCRGDLPEDLVYRLTKQFFAELPALARRHGEAALIDPEQAPAAPIPLHLGAARYYREREVLR